ncbi:MAG: DM13 domain-containing protein [Actinomycetota bacterium]
MGTNRAVVAVAAVVVLGIAAWLAFGFFGIQSAFIDNEVDEAGPVFGSDAEQEEFDEAMEEAAENSTSVDESVDGDMEESAIVTLFDGSFTGVSRYTVTGDALVLNDGSEQRFLRLENFESSNGPDLNVYLRADDGEFVDLGDLKGNIGDQNYEIPADVDLDRFDTVEIWCVRFGVEFGNAPLSA